MTTTPTQDLLRSHEIFMLGAYKGSRAPQIFVSSGIPKKRVWYQWDASFGQWDVRSTVPDSSWNAAPIPRETARMAVGDEGINNWDVIHAHILENSGEEMVQMTEADCRHPEKDQHVVDRLLSAVQMFNQAIDDLDEEDEDYEISVRVVGPRDGDIRRTTNRLRRTGELKLAIKVQKTAVLVNTIASSGKKCRKIAEDALEEEVEEEEEEAWQPDEEE